MSDKRLYIILRGILLIRVILTILTVATVSFKGCAQEPETSVVFDLETCISYAKQHNIRLNNLKLDKKISEQELLLTRAGRMPDLFASATQNLNHVNTIAGGAGNSGSKTSGSGDYGLNSSWTLYRGGYLTSDIRQKNLYVESANLNILQQENDITLGIIQYYLDVLLDKESIKYGAYLVSTSREQVKRARNQLAVGSIAKKDLLQLEAQLANDTYALVTYENAKRQDLINLKQLLQLPVATAFDIVVPDSLQIQLFADDPGIVRQQALAVLPEVKNGIIGIAIAKSGLDKALSGYKPSLTVSGFIGSGYVGASPGYFRQLSNGFNQQLGLRLSVPIFNRRLNNVNVAEAKIKVEQAVLNLTDTRTALSLTIERTYINLVNAQRQFQAASEAFEYNEETYRVANEQLNTGLINMVEYLQQKTLYMQATQQFLQAKYNAAMTYKIYEFYKGKSVKLN